MFRSLFSKEAGPVKTESLQHISKEEAIFMSSIAANKNFNTEVLGYEALMVFMRQDRSALDLRIHTDILEKIAAILAHECGVTLGTNEELEDFLKEYILIKS